MGDTIEKISLDMKKDRLLEDLEKYKNKALEMGAAKAAVIEVKNIPVDDRIPVKVLYWLEAHARLLWRRLWAAAPGEDILDRVADLSDCATYFSE